MMSPLMLRSRPNNFLFKSASLCNEYIFEVFGNFLWIKAFHFNVIYTAVEREISGSVTRNGWQCVGQWKRRVTTKLWC